MFNPDVVQPAPTVNIPATAISESLGFIHTVPPHVAQTLMPSSTALETLKQSSTSAGPLTIPSPTFAVPVSLVSSNPQPHATHPSVVHIKREEEKGANQVRRSLRSSSKEPPLIVPGTEDSLSDDMDLRFGCGGVLDEFVNQITELETSGHAELDLQQDREDQEYSGHVSDEDEVDDDDDEMEDEEEMQDAEYRDNPVPPRRGPGRPPRSASRNMNYGKKILARPYSATIKSGNAKSNKKRKCVQTAPVTRQAQSKANLLLADDSSTVANTVGDPTSSAIVASGMNYTATNSRTGRPVPAFPPGTNWKVSYDAVHIPFAHFEPKIVEKMLTYRTNADGTTEFLVKYKHFSYQHREWVSGQVIQSMTNGAMRVKRFLDKYHSDLGGSAAAAWGEEAFNPAYLRIDRILDEGEVPVEVAESGKPESQVLLFLLVKWEGLAYDQATWEAKSDCDEWDADAVQEFKDRRIVDETKSKRMLRGVARPSLTSWTPYTQSLEYRNGNSLRHYQLEGLNWLTQCWLRGQSSIMADEMGLGKTVQSVSFLHELYSTFNVPGPFLVIAPLSTVPHWEREFRTWTKMNIIVFHGNATSRNLIVDTEFYWKDGEGKLVPGLFKFDVLITTYEMVLASPAQLRPIPWRACVCDEAHKLKNKASKITEMLKAFYMEHRVLLTGTPLQNDIGELWALLNFLEPNKFPDERHFMLEYGSLKTSTDVERLQELLKPLMLRRLKEDVETSIPVKEETVVEVELTTIQKKWYRAILERNFSMLKKGTKGRDALPSLINIVMELRKCCIHPYLLMGAEGVILNESGATTADEQYKCMIQASGKLVLLDKLLVKLKLGGHKVLIFSQMTRCLDILQDFLRGRSYLFERIDGNIRGSERQAAIDRFSAPGSESFVFLLCTRAGGVGINLTAADTAIIYDSDWNPQNDLQAQARCHRIGQKKPVQIYRLVTRNTYEKEMFDRAGLKLGLDKAVLQKMSADATLGPGDDHSGKLSKKEVEELLKKGAYGAFMDDSESAAFCDESIDQILERRTTVIKHDNAPTTVGSIFSKATFVANSSTVDNEIDVNDPDFWDKLAEKAQLEPHEPESVESLILDEPRQRRSHTAAAYQIKESAESDAGAHDDPLLNVPEAVKWSMTEKLFFERRLMVFGVWHWDRITQGLPRRSVNDLQACARDLLLFMMTVLDPRDDAQAISDLGAMARDECEPYCLPQGSDLPYEGATPKQVAEYRSFFISAVPDYRESLALKTKYMVSRLQLLKQVHDLVLRDLELAKQTLFVPPITRPPAEWWGSEEDRDLLIGVVKHGYHVFKPLRRDPDLVFSKRIYDPSTFQELHRRVKRGSRRAMSAIQENVAKEMDSESEDDLAADESDSISVDDQSLTLYPWPSKSELGARLRRIVSAMVRDNKRKLVEPDHPYRINAHSDATASLNFEYARCAKHEPSSSSPPPTRIGKWNKRERTDFYRALCTYGLRLKTIDEGSSSQSDDAALDTSCSSLNVDSLHVTIDWSEIKQAANLSAKSDEVLFEYYCHLYALCRSLMEADLVRNRGGVGMIRRPRYGWEGDDEFTLDKAKKLVKRLELLDILRQHVVTRPDLQSELTRRAKKTAGLPDWWQLGIHDYWLLIGCSKHGFGRYEAMVSDPSLGFYPLIGSLQPKHISTASAAASPPLSTLLGLPWPSKDNILTRRIEMLLLMLASNVHSIDPTDYIPPLYQAVDYVYVTLSEYFGRQILQDPNSSCPQPPTAAMTQQAIPLRSNVRLSANSQDDCVGKRKLRLTVPPLVAVHDTIVAPAQPSDMLGTTVTMDAVGPNGIRRTLVLHLPGNPFLGQNPTAEPDIEFATRTTQRITQSISQENIQTIRIPDPEHRYTLDSNSSETNNSEWQHIRENESSISLPLSSLSSQSSGSSLLFAAHKTTFSPPVPSRASIYASPASSHSFAGSPITTTQSSPRITLTHFSPPKFHAHFNEHSSGNSSGHTLAAPKIAAKVVLSNSSSPSSSSFKIRIKPRNALTGGSPSVNNLPPFTIKSPSHCATVTSVDSVSFPSEEAPLNLGLVSSVNMPASIPVSALLNGEPMDITSESEMSEI